MNLDTHEPVHNKNFPPWRLDETRDALYFTFVTKALVEGKTVSYDESNPFQALDAFHVIIHNDELHY